MWTDGQSRMWKAGHPDLNNEVVISDATELSLARLSSDLAQARGLSARLGQFLSQLGFEKSSSGLKMAAHVLKKC